MNKPLEVNKDAALQFLSLFSNANAFYVSARSALLSNSINVGCSNSHQAIELYIKAIVAISDDRFKEIHNLSKLLENHAVENQYFSDLLNDSQKREFLDQLTSGYFTLRYGEGGAFSNSKEIIKLVDEIVFHLRNIYLKNLNVSSRKIYVHDSVKEKFLEDNAFFSEGNITNNLSANYLPIDDISLDLFK